MKEQWLFFKLKLKRLTYGKKGRKAGKKILYYGRKSQEKFNETISTL